MGKARPKKTNSVRKTTLNQREGESKPIWALLFLTLAVLFAVSMWDYEPNQSRWVTTDAGTNPENLVGKLGAETSFWAIRIFGVSAWWLPVFACWLSYVFFAKKSHKLGWTKLLLLTICLVSSSGLAALIKGSGQPYIDNNNLYGSYNYYTAGFGGITGIWTYDHLFSNLLGKFGSSLLFTFGILLGPIVILEDCLEIITQGSLSKLKALGPTMKNAFLRLPELLQKKTSTPEPVTEPTGLPQTTTQPIQAAPKATKHKTVIKAPAPQPPKLTPKKKEGLVLKRGEEEETIKVEPLPNMEEEAALSPSEISKLGLGTPPTAKTPQKEQPVSYRNQGIKIIEGEKTEKAAKIVSPKGNYIAPEISLLNESEEIHQESAESHIQTAETLKSILAQFGIKVELGEVHTGPVITRYEVFPAPGVRVEKISNLDKNIAMGLKAHSVRILAPVPGKGCVGIEIPNKNPAAVCIRDILESKAWANSKAEIPLALGKEVSGKTLIADLTKMPHLLIAGATGAGKTVCINSIIASLLYHAGPQDLRFIMIDPKIVEMQVYNSLPHMLIPVVTEPKKVPGALKWLIAEMERRYQIFAKKGVRNIAGFNAKQAKDKENEKKQQELDAELTPEERAAVSSIEVPRDMDDIEIPRKLPYIVCIIDELADLMMVAPAEIETAIARLAQLARAAGIHLIIATQRPSVNVITGVIKANLPSRIAFKVASKVDSRTILDVMGADKLIGRGDMLFLPPGSSNILRAQGAFVSDDEINGIVEHLKRNGPPQYAKEVQEQIDSGGADNLGSGSGEDEDELVPQAIDVIRNSKRASTSMLQRRLRIGYNRAARIMEILEDKGIVGPENGAQPREILQDLDNL